MLSSLALLALLPLSSLANTVPSRSQRRDYLGTCKAISKAISSASSVFYPGSADYEHDIEHWVPTSAEEAACSVEPGTSADVSAILKVLGKSNTPFAIRNGGHAINKKFSSTTGVQISLYRLNSVTYDSAKQLVTIGSGLTWDQVYAELEPYGVTVVGGHNTGVGVSGFLLGGGYSWLTNAHGLAIDNLAGFELVLPSGKIVNVSATSYPDLFFGLKGGFNNFGIVTKFVLNAYSQGSVWGGLLIFGGDQIEDILQATSDFEVENTDPKTDLITLINNTNGTTSVLVNIFYNAPTQPEGVFDKILAIPTQSSNLTTRSFAEYVNVVSVTTDNASHLRGQQASVSIPRLSIPVLRSLVNITATYAATVPGASFTTEVEPMIHSVIVRSNISETAYPHASYFTSLVLIWLWPDESSDTLGYNATKNAAAAIKAAVIADGQNQNGVVEYPNHAIDFTPASEIYGPNLPRLVQIAKKYDPAGVMKNTGGFHFY